MDNQFSDSTTNVVPAENSNAVTPAPTLAQRVIKIQFHLQNMAQSAIIIGQELIECKKEVGHGNWQAWLQDNFKMTDRTARNFMNIAERFSNSELISDLDSTQLISLLALPAGEEEKFIEEKAAEGKPVEDMTVKKLRDEIKKWKTHAENAKSKIEEKDAEAEKLKKENEELKEDNAFKLEVNRRNAEDYFKLREQYEQLQEEKTVEVFPPDYEETKQQIEVLQDKIAQLQAKLNQTPVEVIPSDYENIKKQLADLQAQQDFFKVDIATSQALNQFFMMANFLHEHKDRLPAVLNGYLDSDPLTSQRVNQSSDVVNLLKKFLADISN